MRHIIEEHDRALLGVARTLTDSDWRRPSLCDGWANRDVLAHLVLGARFPLGDLAVTMAREGSFDRASDVMARRLSAATPTLALLDELERHMDRLPLRTRLLFPPRFLLGDRLVHHLDIVLALGREPHVPAEAASNVLRTQVTVPNPLVPARRNARGLRLEATDVDWSHGPAGAPLVRGSAARLVSVLAGRPRALADLRGDGVDALGARVAPATGGPVGSGSDQATSAET
ncbi:MAG: maleylpyruvate isomerase family mycothiol-dependent enzyme [Actinomycetota bacterium]|nr:maleylpyruvate isomerase family mycothiol-dependent enzyme [Actinomycetota bacterium]